HPCPARAVEGCAAEDARSEASRDLTRLPVRCAILAIGDEIVNGITVDTNSTFLADVVRGVGVETVGGFSVDDDEGRIARALERAMEDAEVVLTTGGLGPTADDLTSAVVARVAGRGQRTDAESLRRIEE